METLTTCPRGHALEPNAVYCTVCWIRVEPEDPERVAARRKRRRRMILGIPLLGAGSIVVGVLVGSLLANDAGDGAPAVTALEPAAVAVSAAPVDPIDQPVAVVAEPLAGTVTDPVTDPADTGCAALVRDVQVPCALTDDRLEFTVCVPAATTVIRVGTRPNDNVTFDDASSDIALGGSAGCATGDIAADIAIDSYSPAATWRIVGRDASDTKIWKSRVVTLPPAP